MKTLYADVKNLFYKVNKYRPDEKLPNLDEYEKKVHLFMQKLNTLENEFNLSIDSDWSQDCDGFTESKICLYDNTYGYLGEIFDEEKV